MFYFIYKKIIQVESTMTEMIGVHDPTRVYEFNQQVNIDLNVTWVETHTAVEYW